MDQYLVEDLIEVCNMVDERLKKLPVRLVQEGNVNPTSLNGNTIPLDVTSYNITVERGHSHIPLPFRDGQTFGVDLNMPTISIALTGYLVDDGGNNVPGEGAKGEIDVGFDLPDSLTPAGTGPTQNPSMSPGAITQGTGQSTSPGPLLGLIGFLPDSWDADGEVTSDISGNLPAITKATDLHGKYFDVPVSKWASDTDSTDTHIRFIFDGHREPTVKEPYVYLNKDRNTTLTYTSTIGTSGSDITIRVSGGDAREWFGDVTTGGEYEVLVTNSGTTYSLGFLKTVTSNQLVIHNVVGAPTPTMSAGDAIGIAARLGSGTGSQHPLSSISPSTCFGWAYGVPGIPKHEDSQSGQPVVVIPVRDLIIGGPTLLNDDTTRRDLGGAWSPIGYMAYKIEKALTSTVSLGTKYTGDTSGTSCNDAFSVERQPSRVGDNKGLIIITQKVAGSLPAGQNGENRRMIHHNFARNAGPIFDSFRGGKDALKVKSAGDKAQDLIGTISNMQNYYKGPAVGTGTVGTLLDPFLGIVDDASGFLSFALGKEIAKDYICGIQIPYWSTVKQITLEQPTKDIINAVASSGNTVFTVRQNPHGYLVGDKVRISNFSILNGTMTNDLSGEYTITAVDTDDNTFTVATSSGSNSGNVSATVDRLNVETKSILRDQRNFFLTYGNKSDATPLKTGATGQLYHASQPFEIRGFNSERPNGIRASIDEFTVDFNAEDRLYEFDMTMMAVDHII